MWAIFTISLRNIYIAGWLNIIALPVIIAALVLNGQSAPVWSPVVGCGYITNPSNYSFAYGYVENTNVQQPVDGNDPYYYTTYSYYGMNATGNGYDKSAALDCALSLFGDKVWLIDHHITCFYT